MIVLARRFVVPLALCLLFCSCSGEPEREPTYPVQGVVSVDGTPAAGLQVTCHAVEGMGTDAGRVCSGMTLEEGEFEINTFTLGDGVPEGDYVATFMWGKTNYATMTYGGPDKLKKRYSDPQESQVKFTVKDGEPTDLGTIELTTK